MQIVVTVSKLSRLPMVGFERVRVKHSVSSKVPSVTMVTVIGFTRSVSVKSTVPAASE